MISLRSPKLLSVAGLLVTVVAFLLGLVFFFPAEALRPRLEREALSRGVQMTIGTLQTVFPLGVVAKDLSLARKDGQEVLRLDEIRLSPSLWGLFRGRIVMNYRAKLLGGQVEGEMQRSGPLTMRAQGLSWRGELPGLSGGILSLQLRQGELVAAWPIVPTTTLLLSVDCDEAKIDGFLGTKNPLQIGRVIVRGEGQGKDLRLTTLNASGGQLGVEGSGTILLNQPLDRSLLNLNLVLRGQNGLDPTLAELLTALLPPAADGTSRLRLGGTLSAPQKVSTGR